MLKISTKEKNMKYLLKRRSLVWIGFVIIVCTTFACAIHYFSKQSGAPYYVLFLQTAPYCLELILIFVSIFLIIKKKVSKQVIRLQTGTFLMACTPKFVNIVHIRTVGENSLYNEIALVIFIVPMLIVLLISEVLGKKHKGVLIKKVKRINAAMLIFVLIYVFLYIFVVENNSFSRDYAFFSVYEMFLSTVYLFVLYVNINAFGYKSTWIKKILIAINSGLFFVLSFASSLNYNLMFPSGQSYWKSEFHPHVENVLLNAEGEKKFANIYIDQTITYNQFAGKDYLEKIIAVSPLGDARYQVKVDIIDTNTLTKRFTSNEIWSEGENGLVMFEKPVMKEDIKFRWKDTKEINYNRIPSTPTEYNQFVKRYGDKTVNFYRCHTHTTWSGKLTDKTCFAVYDKENNIIVGGLELSPIADAEKSTKLTGVILEGDEIQNQYRHLKYSVDMQSGECQKEITASGYIKPVTANEIQEYEKNGKI